MSTVQMTSELRPEKRDAGFLTAAAVGAWSASLPPDAHVTALTSTAGDQRDSWTVFAGLRATWTEHWPDLPGATATYGSVIR